MLSMSAFTICRLITDFFFFFFLMIRRPPRSPLFPYTPLSRSQSRLPPLLISLLTPGTASNHVAFALAHDFHHPGDGNRARGQTLRDCWRVLASAARSKTAGGGTGEKGERNPNGGGGASPKRGT